MFAILAFVASGVTHGPDLKAAMGGLIPKGSLEGAFAIYTRRLRNRKLLRGTRPARNLPLRWEITPEGKKALKASREFYQGFSHTELRKRRRKKGAR